MKKLFPSILDMYTYFKCYGLFNIFIYLLCSSVLIFILYKIYLYSYKFILKFIGNKNYNSSKKNSSELSSFESRTSDFNLNKNNTCSISKKKNNKSISKKNNSDNKFKNKIKIKNLLKNEILLSSILS
jgi:hypothetical protein